MAKALEWGILYIDIAQVSMYYFTIYIITNCLTNYRRQYIFGGLRILDEDVSDTLFQTRKINVVQHNDFCQSSQCESLRISTLYLWRKRRKDFLFVAFDMSDGVSIYILFV